MHTEHWFVQGKYLGSVSIRPFRTNGEVWAKFFQQAFLCPFCGTLWAKRTFDYSEKHLPKGFTKRWTFKYLACNVCGEGFILRPDTFPIEFQTLPTNVLKYEFLRRYHSYDRK